MVSFVFLFLFPKHIALSFVSWCFDAFVGCLYVFFLQPFYFVWEQPTSFATLSVELPHGRGFIVPVTDSADSSLVGAIFPVNQPDETAH